MEVLFYVGMIMFGFYCLVTEPIEDVRKDFPWMEEQIMIHNINNIGSGLIEPTVRESELPTNIVATLSEIRTQYSEVERFLIELASGGGVNMYGSPSYLVEQYGITETQARELVTYWIETFTSAVIEVQHIPQAIQPHTKQLSVPTKLVGQSPTDLKHSSPLQLYYTIKSI